MRYIELLEEHPSHKARAASDLKFLEWLFLLFQLSAVVLILGRLVGIFQPQYLAQVLDVVSQNASIPVLVILLGVHLAIGLMFLFVNRPMGYYLILALLAGLGAFSLEEIIFQGPSGYRIAGLVVEVFWITYFLLSAKIKLRFFYAEIFSTAVRTIICPQGKKEVILDAEDCPHTLTEAERFQALTQRITDVALPIPVRAAQIRLLRERFPNKAVPFLAELYKRQMSADFPVTRLVVALKSTLGEQTPKL